MSKSFSTLFGFIFGAAVGSGVTYYVLNSKYEQEKDRYYNDEVTPARDEYLKKIKEITEINRTNKEKISEVYNDLTKTLGYVTDSAIEKAEDIKESIEEKVDSSLSAAESLINDVKENVISALSSNDPNAYFISINEYGNTNFEQVEAVYHADGVVTNESYERIDDFVNLIGKENYDKLASMLETGKDIAYIRNDDRLMDFEIQLVDFDFNE